MLLSKGHGVNRQLLVVGEHQDDHLEHVSRPVWSHNEDLRWIGVGIEVDHHDRTLDRVPHICVAWAEEGGELRTVLVGGLGFV